MPVSAKGFGWKKEGEKRKKGRVRVVCWADFFFLLPLFSSDEKTGTTYPQTPRRFVRGTGQGRSLFQPFRMPEMAALTPTVPTYSAAGAISKCMTSSRIPSLV